MAIVYIHKRLDNNEIFYVGIGKSEKRIFDKKSRNLLWHNYVNKFGFSVEIIKNDISWEEACKIETDLIKKHGRKDLNTGILVNMTDGGDGNNNFSFETINKISKSLAGKKQSLETINKRKISSKKTWQNENLRELKRIQAKKLNELGLIGTKGKKSSKKGKKFSGDINKLSKSLKDYYKNNNVWNKKTIDNEVINEIIELYKTESLKYIANKFNLSRRILTRVLKENNILIKNKKYKYINLEEFFKLSLSKTNKELAGFYKCSISNIERLKRKK